MGGRIAPSYLNVEQVLKMIPYTGMLLFFVCRKKHFK